MKKKPLEPMKELLGWFWWLLVVVEVVGKVGKRNQELEVGSKAKDWLFFEEMLWIPWRKNHGFLLLWWLLEKETEEIMECHCLQTVEERIKFVYHRRKTAAVALRHYHRRLVVRASSSFKNRSLFFLDLGASVPGIQLLHRAPAAVCRALNHHRLRLVVADSSNPPPSSEFCSSLGLCLCHDSASLFSDCSVKKPISIPVSFLRVQRAEAQPRTKP
ncbi:hypothetical protein AHAS_Ahas04G0111000 [Arachis hypogaea]